MKYIPYHARHFDTCLAIFNSNVPNYFAENERDEFIEWLTKGDTTHYYVIIDKGEAVGCGGVFIDHDNVLCGFAWGMIRRDHHRKGYGRAFSEFRIGLLKELCNYSIRLVTSQHTFAFYEKLGFETTSFEKDGFQEGLDKYTMYLGSVGR